MTQQNVTLSTIAAADSTTFYEIDDVQPSDTGLSWLQKNLVVQYWRGHGCTEEGSEGHDSCNLTRDWLVFLKWERTKLIFERNLFFRSNIISRCKNLCFLYWESELV